MGMNLENGTTLQQTKVHYMHIETCYTGEIKIFYDVYDTKGEVDIAFNLREGVQVATLLLSNQ